MVAGAGIMNQITDVYRGDQIMLPAFVSMVSWAFSEPGIRSWYEADTGATLPPSPRNGLEAMIDEASGVNDAYVMGFAEWAYVALWGMEEADVSAT